MTNRRSADAVVMRSGADLAGRAGRAVDRVMSCSNQTRFPASSASTPQRSASASMTRRPQPCLGQLIFWPERIGIRRVARVACMIMRAVRVRYLDAERAQIAVDRDRHGPGAGLACRTAFVSASLRQSTASSQISVSSQLTSSLATACRTCLMAAGTGLTAMTDVTSGSRRCRGVTAKADSPLAAPVATPRGWSLGRPTSNVHCFLKLHTESRTHQTSKLFFMPVESPRPQYRQLADLIRAAIEQGEFPPGSELPAEDQLASLHGVSRATVNRAVLILRGEGAVRVVRGRGTVVRELPVLRRDGITRQRADLREADAARGAFQAELARLGLSARSEVGVAEQVPPAEVAEPAGHRARRASSSRGSAGCTATTFLCSSRSRTCRTRSRPAPR